MSVELWWKVTDRDRRKLKKLKERNRKVQTWIILTFHLCHGLPNSLFPSCSLTKSFKVFPSAPYFLPTIMKLLTLHFSPISFHFLPLGPKYFPQHSVLNGAKPLFLSQYDTPSSTNKHTTRNGVFGVLVFKWLERKIKRRPTFCTGRQRHSPKLSWY